MARSTEIEVVDADTGEVKSLEQVPLNAKATLALIKKVSAAKAAEFEEPEKDFWKPTAEDPELRGVYLGSETVGSEGKRRRVHALGTLSEKTGRPLAVRFNGTASLNGHLKDIEPGTPVWIRLSGSAGTVDGYTAKLFEVRILKTE